MSIDNLFEGLNIEAETITGVYNLDDDTIEEKLKRLMKGASNTDKAHEVIEMIKMEADTPDEAMVLSHLMMKGAVTVAQKNLGLEVSSFCLALTMAVSLMQKNDDINDEAARGLLSMTEELVNKLMEQFGIEE